jgi:hypothetical protein
MKKEPNEGKWQKIGKQNNKNLSQQPASEVHMQFFNALESLGPHLRTDKFVLGRTYS